MEKTWNRQRVGSLVVRATLATTFTVAAGMKFAAMPFEVVGFERFGYPLWFMYSIGALQLLGAGLLWVRGLTSIGAALLAVMMVGAVGSHGHADDPVVMTIPALALLILLIALAYSRRAELTVVVPMMSARRS
ncbi:DoxX family protein [Methylorubrum extorquens]|uniref:DoxX family protein n=1 Tax=Methylorubrum extorquens TaxID=408 RepID=A0A1S1P796_METEX|nr:DoxX family protein [Methylorubrum extorquens]